MERTNDTISLDGSRFIQASGSGALRAQRPAFPPETLAHIFPSSSQRRPSEASRRQVWHLVFERVSAPDLDWPARREDTGEPLSCVRLTFPTLQAAIAHAERQGVPYLVEGQPRRRISTGTAAGGRQAAMVEALSTYLLFAWWDAQYGRAATPEPVDMEAGMADGLAGTG